MRDARRTIIVCARGGSCAEAFGGRIGYGRVGCDRGVERGASHADIHTIRTRGVGGQGMHAQADDAAVVAAMARHA